MLHSIKTKLGECEGYHTPELVNVPVYLMHGSMWLCQECKDKELAAIESSKATKQVVESARKQDDTIELSQDIYNATTTSFAQLIGAFQADSNIPADKKDYALMVEVAARVDKLTEVIFAEKAATLAKENERYAWIQNMQKFAAKLRLEEREKFKQYDVNYKPSTISKSDKSVKGTKTPRAFDKVKVYAAAKKYGVSATDIQMRVVAGNNKNEENAGAYLCGKVAEKYGIDPEILKASIIGRNGVSAEEVAAELKQILG